MKTKIKITQKKSSIIFEIPVPENLSFEIAKEKALLKILDENSKFIKEFFENVKAMKELCRYVKAIGSAENAVALAEAINHLRSFE